MTAELAAKAQQVEEQPALPQDGAAFLEQGWTPVTAAVSGTVVDIRAQPGKRVDAGDTVIVLEAMKMEFAVTVEQCGLVENIAVIKGEVTVQGAVLVWLSSQQ